MKHYHTATYNMDYTLCGQSKTEGDIAWDPPLAWHERETSDAISWGLPKCPKCLAHPDLPLLILGEL